MPIEALGGRSHHPKAPAWLRLVRGHLAVNRIKLQIRNWVPVDCIFLMDGVRPGTQCGLPGEQTMFSSWSFGPRLTSRSSS